MLAILLNIRLSFLFQSVATLLSVNYTIVKGIIKETISFYSFSIKILFFVRITLKFK